MKQINLLFALIDHIEVEHTNPEILEEIISGIEGIGVNCKRNPIDSNRAYIITSENEHLTDDQVHSFTNSLCCFATFIKFKMINADQYNKQATIH